MRGAVQGGGYQVGCDIFDLGVGREGAVQGGETSLVANTRASRIGSATLWRGTGRSRTGCVEVEQAFLSGGLAGLLDGAVVPYATEIVLA
jgi:hypothetical protein